MQNWNGNLAKHFIWLISMNIHWPKLWTGICHKQHSLYNKNNNNNKLLTKLRQGVKRIGIIGSVEKRKVRTSGSCEHLLSGHLTSLRSPSQEIWSEGRDDRECCAGQVHDQCLYLTREKKIAAWTMRLDNKHLRRLKCFWLCDMRNMRP